MDLITQLPTSQTGKDAITVIVDKFTKFVILEPCNTDATAVHIAEILERRLIGVHGAPKTIISDRDPRFRAEYFQEWCASKSIEHHMSTSHHPQTDGQTERTNRVLEDVLRSFVQPTLDNWDTLLPAAQLAINNAYHESLRTTPFFLTYGRNAWLPGTPRRVSAHKEIDSWTHELETAIKRARECLHQAQSRQRTVYDRRHRPLEFEPGQRVMLNTKHLKFKGPNCKKLMPRWCGPLTVERRVGSVAYKLTLPPNINIHPVFHVSMLKAYCDTGEVVLPPTTQVVADDYPIEAILKHQLRGNKRRGIFHYLVKWQGLGPAWNSWVDEREINCPRELATYWKTQPPATIPAKYTDILSSLARDELL